MEALPPDLDPRLMGRASSAAAWLRERRSLGQTVTVVHHIDADGVAAGAIASSTLRRAGIDHLLHPVPSLDEVQATKILATSPESLWFCDLGSAMPSRFDLPRIVCDHHQLVRDGSEESFPHVNPLLDGLSGESISGAGCAYLVAAHLDPRNLDLLPLALVGATGDLQDRRGWQGTNAALLQHGVAAGLLHAELDVSWYGPESRPLAKYLSLGSDPEIPGISRDARAAERLLARVGVDPRATWSSLSPESRRNLRDLLVNHLLDLGLKDRVSRLFRTVVRIRAEAPGPTRELQEYCTLLNGTARYDRPDVGIAVATGDRGAIRDEALDLLQGHRRHLAGALDALESAGIQEGQSIQWVHLQDKVRDTVVGIVCGMALDGMRRDRALVGLAWTRDGRTKVSARAPHELRSRGIDLASALREAASHVGGQGGGHEGAAGATIPRDKEAAFLTDLDARVSVQLGLHSRTTIAY